MAKMKLFYLDGHNIYHQTVRGNKPDGPSLVCTVAFGIDPVKIVAILNKDIDLFLKAQKKTLAARKEKMPWEQ